MGALDKLETIAVMGVLAGAGYLIWSNWEKIADFFKNPFGIPPIVTPDLSCKLTMNQCWAQEGPYSTVDTVNCKCTPSIEPHVCNPGYHFNEAGFCVPDVPPEDCGSGYRKNPVTGECEIIMVDPPCSRYNGNFGLPVTCPDGSQVCDSRSCPSDPIVPVMSIREIYESKILRRFYPTVDDCNYIHQQDRDYWNELVQRGFCQSDTGFSDCVKDCPGIYPPGAIVEKYDSCTGTVSDCFGSGIIYGCAAVRDSCHPLSIGAHSQTAISKEACDSYGMTHYGMGSCWNDQQEAYNQCLGDCVM